MGSLGLLVWASPGRKVYSVLIISWMDETKSFDPLIAPCSKPTEQPHKEALFWGDGMYPAGGMGASAPIFVIHSIHTLLTK
jgi:hypothetical protein